MSHKRTSIVSICGICERVAAEIFIEEGRATKIERRNFPSGAPTKPLTFDAPDGKTRCRLCLSTPDECQCEASFAIVIADKDRGRLNELIADLRA